MLSAELNAFSSDLMSTVELNLNHQPPDKKEALTLSKTTDFRLFQTDRVFRRLFQV